MLFIRRLYMVSTFALSLVLLGLGCASTAAAAMLDFDGTIFAIYDPRDATTHLRSGTLPPLAFTPGDSFTGRIVWDDNATDRDADPENGAYLGALELLRIQLDGHTWEIHDGDMQIIPDVFDPIQLMGVATGSPLGTFAPDHFAVDFNDPGNLISDDALPLVDSAFTSFIEGGSFSLNFLDATANLTFEIEADLVRYSVVPEPSTALLLGLGLLGIRFACRERAHDSHPRSGAR